LTDKDTSRVIVGEFPANPQEKLFNNLNWICPWDCALEIKNLYGYISPDHIFKVFIKRDNASLWVEVFHWSSALANDYAYSFYNGDLWINYSGSDVNDTPDIKILY